MNKRGQIKLSFGMIFSIILIIAFIIFAFYAIKKFLEFRDEVEIAKFKEKLQNEINNVWRSSQASQPFEYRLPTKIQAICFVDDYENVLFMLEEYPEPYNFEHLDIEKTLAGNEKLCIANIDGKINMILQKEFDEALVTISK